MQYLQSYRHWKYIVLYYSNHGNKQLQCRKYGKQNINLKYYFEVQSQTTKLTRINFHIIILFINTSNNAHLHIQLYINLNHQLL